MSFSVYFIVFAYLRLVPGQVELTALSLLMYIIVTIIKLFNHRSTWLQTFLCLIDPRTSKGIKFFDILRS